jgi:hypothetical protein
MISGNYYGVAASQETNDLGYDETTERHAPNESRCRLFVVIIII